MWLMNGSNITGGGVIHNDPNWSITKSGDFNGDGKTDLIWRNSSNGETAHVADGRACLCDQFGIEQHKPFVRTGR